MTDILEGSLSASPHVVESGVADETVLLHLVNGTYYGLDPVGTRIWTLLKNGQSMPEICRQLSDEYSVDLKSIEADARKFVGDLMEQGILHRS